MNDRCGQVCTSIAARHKNDRMIPAHSLRKVEEHIGELHEEGHSLGAHGRSGHDKMFTKLLTGPDRPLLLSLSLSGDPQRVCAFRKFSPQQNIERIQHVHHGGPLQQTPNLAMDGLAQLRK